MRVAFLNRDPKLWAGGDLIEIENRMAALSKMGIACDYGPTKLYNYDLAHVFHCNFGWSYENYARVRAEGIPYVSTPLYYPDVNDLSKQDIAWCLKGAGMVTPFSSCEAQELANSLGISLTMEIIPNGTSKEFHAENGVNRSGVCTAVARADCQKNSGLIEEACRLAKLPYKALYGIPRDKMPGEYRRYKVFVSASESERMSLVIGEALCAGCRVLATTKNRGNEWYPGIQTIDPTMPVEDLAARIREAYVSEDWDWQPNETARLLTWDRIARRVESVYREVIGKWRG